jgi:Protein of unknown function (DUF3040)
MPLSERDEAIIATLERLFEPKRVHGRFLRVPPRLSRRARRGVAIAGFVTGTAVLIATFTTSITVGVLGLVVMIFSALFFVHASSRP